MINQIKLVFQRKGDALFLIFIALLFIASPFYTQSNTSSIGLELPLNLSTWWTVSVGIAVSMLMIFFSRSLIYPKWILFFIVFPVFILISSLLSEVNRPDIWVFRQLFVLGGLIFLIALFQFKPTVRTIERALYLIVIATLLHAFIATVSIMSPTILAGLVPIYGDGVPRGVFQQVNVHVTFLTTGCLIAFYLISRPGFNSASLLRSCVLLLTIALTSYIIFMSGSRVGLLSLLVGLSVMLLCRYRQLFKHKKVVFMALFLVCSSVFIGQSGVKVSMDKSALIVQEEYGSPRVAMYRIGLDAIAQSPIYGHGIGNFLQAWNTQTYAFIQENPKTALPRYVSHPHNEILFWMIESGALALVGILFVFMGVVLGLLHCGLQRGGAYFAMLLPITLHTQVELPFYMSSIHWFLWLFIIFMILRHQTKAIKVTLSDSANGLIAIMAMVLPIVVTLFMINTSRAQEEVFHFIHDEVREAPYMPTAKHNLYFSVLAEQLLWRYSLYAGIQNNDENSVKAFVAWAKPFLAMNPELKTYRDLIRASLFLNPEVKACDVISNAFKMYAQDEEFQLIQQQCQRDYFTFIPASAPWSG